MNDEACCIPIELDLAFGFSCANRAVQGFQALLVVLLKTLFKCEMLNFVRLFLFV